MKHENIFSMVAYFCFFHQRFVLRKKSFFNPNMRQTSWLDFQQTLMNSEFRRFITLGIYTPLEKMVVYQLAIMIFASLAFQALVKFLRLNPLGVNFLQHEFKR